MKKESAKGNTVDKKPHQPYKVRLPGFLLDTDVGLGDVIKRATSAIGIRPCSNCTRRASALNRWAMFTGRDPK